MLTPALHDRLAGPGYPERDRRMDWEAAKTRGLSVLMARAKRGDPGLGNAEIRRITRLSRQQVKLLMQELRAANPGPRIRPVFWPLQAIRPCRPKIGGTSLNGSMVGKRVDNHSTGQYGHKPDLNKKKHCYARHPTD